jgi:hypothetical protein
MTKLTSWLVAVLAVPAALSACSDDPDSDAPGGTGGTGGSAGSAGKGGTAGKGSGGTAGKGGAGGAGGASGGTAGKGGSSGGKGGKGGTTGGTAGNNVGGEGGDDPVTGGTAGTTGGTAGAGGEPNLPECDLSGDGKERENLPNPISSDFTATSDTVWTISGNVHIESGATLTIEPCTRLEGTPAPNPGVLYAVRGGRLVAEGTADEPILFTSAETAGNRAGGQWGGVVLLGRAPITRPAAATEALYEGLTDAIYTYGGNVADDDSGSLSYVRIEFGGYEILPDKEINGLSLAGVGTGTSIHHIMVSNTLDDCFEWWGGGVRADYLICNNAGDDNFDTDDGWVGGGDYWFGRRSQAAIDSDDPNGLEMDSQNDGTTPRTAFSLDKVTLCGTGAASGRPNPQWGMVLRELVTGTIDHLDLLGFEYGIDTRNAFVTGDVTISNSQFWGLVNAGAIGNAAETDNDMAFDDATIFTGGTDNSEPSSPAFTVEDCLNGGAAPAASVLDSGTGAFADGADWLDGLWVDWSED